MKNGLVHLVFFAVLCFQGNAQSTHVGIGVGQTLYWGDLNSPDFGTNLRNNNGYAIQAFIRHHYNGYLAFRVNALFGRLRGNDAHSNVGWQQLRNLRFRSVVNELSLGAEFYPFKFLPNDEDNIFSPYLFAGVSGFYFNPTTDLNGNEFELQPLGTEGQGMAGYPDKYKRVAAGWMLGGGMAFRVNDQLTIHTDVITRRTTTDYLDDVSSNYINYFELRDANGILSATLADRTAEFLGSTEPHLRNTGEQRGGSKVKDYFFTGVISFSIKFADGPLGSGIGRGSSIDCPRF